jgi:hypothetical protein
MKTGKRIRSSRRRLVTILAGLTLAAGLGGCISSEDLPTIPIIRGLNGSPAELLGTWHYAAVTVDGQPQDLAAWLGWQAETTAARLIVNDDYSQRREERDAQDAVVNTLAGHFAVDGDQIVLTVTTENGEAVDAYTALTAAWQVGGDTLTLTETGDGYTAVIQLTR